MKNAGGCWTTCAIWAGNRSGPTRTGPATCTCRMSAGACWARLRRSCPSRAGPWKYARTILMRQGGPDRLEWAMPHHLAAVIAALDRDAKRHGRRRR